MRSAPSDLDKKERAKKEVVKGLPTLRPQSPNLPILIAQPTYFGRPT